MNKLVGKITYIRITLRRRRLELKKIKWTLWHTGAYIVSVWCMYALSIIQICALSDTPPAGLTTDTVRFPCGGRRATFFDIGLRCCWAGEAEHWFCKRSRRQFGVSAFLCSALSRRHNYVNLNEIYSNGYRRARLIARIHAHALALIYFLFSILSECLKAKGAAA